MAVLLCLELTISYKFTLLFTYLKSSKPVQVAHATRRVVRLKEDTKCIHKKTLKNKGNLNKITKSNIMCIINGSTNFIIFRRLPYTLHISRKKSTTHCNIQCMNIFFSAEFLHVNRPGRLRARDPIRALENVVKSLSLLDQYRRDN